VNELLERAEHVVRQSVEAPANRVELLISIGRQYWNQDEDERGRRVLEEAYAASRALSHQSTRARASCALATALGRSSDLPRAEALVQEGLRELPDQPHMAVDRIACLLSAQRIASEQGKGEQAVSLAEAALRLLRQSPLRNKSFEFDVFNHLASSYWHAGRFADADAAFREASLKLAALGRGETSIAAAFYNNWGLVLLLTGRPLEAGKMYRRAISISSSGPNEEGASPIYLMSYARVLVQMARYAEAADYAERSYAQARRGGNQTAINQSLLLRAEIYRELGDLKRAGEMLSEVEPRFRRALPARHVAFASLASIQALVAEAQKDLKRASDLADQAVSLTESTGSERAVAYYLQIFLVRRSNIRMQLGRVSEASNDAARAVRVLQHVVQPGTFSAHLGRASLAHGRALRASGKLEEARAALFSAEENLKNAVGPDHPATRSARQLINDVNSASK
jgi:non-specific serine/threonine protein kinase/serine/threonine-protein kinase